MNNKTPLTAINQYCLQECSWGDQEMVKTCRSYQCVLFPYRFGEIMTAKDLAADVERAKEAIKATAEKAQHMYEN